MIQIKTKKKLDKTIIVHKLKKTEQINTMELDILQKKEIEALEPVQVKTSFTGCKMSFRIENYMDVPSYLKSGVTFGNFIKLVEAILGVVMECHSRGIRVSNLEMRPEYIYYNYTLGKLKMLYWPIISLDEYPDEKILFQQLSEYYVCKAGDEFFKERYTAYFSNRKEFDFYHFEAAIHILDKQWKGKHSPLTDPDDGGTIRLVSGQDSGTGIYDQTVYNQTVALQNPVLLHIATNTRVEIDKDSFLIGRSASSCDYAVTDNVYVGRKHAIIQKENGKVYIIDQDSVNGVKVDGKRITPGERVLLHYDEMIEIGNEEFKFLNGK